MPRDECFGCSCRGARYSFEMAHRAFEGPDIKAIAVLVSGSVLFFLPIFTREMQPFTDYGAHIEFAATVLRGGEIELSHFAFQYGVALLYWLGLSLTAAATVLSLIAVSATALGLFLIFRRNAEPWPAALLGFALLVIGPLSLVTLPEKELYLGYMTPNVYHNPTLVLLKPIALGLLVLGSRAFEKRGSLESWWTVGAAAALSVLSCFTKPSFQICFVPGMGLLAALALVRRQGVDLRLCVLGVALPSLLALGWQYLVSFEGVVSSEIIFLPFEVINHLSDRTLLKFFLSILFPVLVTASFFRAAVEDKMLMLSWATALFGIAYAYLLAETGGRLAHGNFLWSGYISIFVLYVSSVPLLLREKKTAMRQACWGVFALQVASGGIFAASQIFGQGQLLSWG